MKGYGDDYHGNNRTRFAERRRVCDNRIAIHYLPDYAKP